MRFDVARAPVRTGRAHIPNGTGLSKACRTLEPFKQAATRIRCLIFNLEFFDFGGFGLRRLDPVLHLRHGHDRIGVARKLRLELQSEIKKIQRELNVTIVNVTHDQEEALTMSDSVVVVNAGRIERHAPPREIYERPTSLFVAAS